MATFTQEELDFIRAHGNDECAKTWLGLWNVAEGKRTGRGPQPAQDQREHIIDKYEKQRYYLQPASPLKTIGAAAATGLGGGGGGVGSGSSTATNSSSSHPSSPASLASSSATSSSSSSADNNNNIVQQQNQLNLKAIQLTPPASTRTSGRHHQNHVLNNNGGGGRLHNSNNNNNNKQNHNGSNGNAFAEDSLFSGASQQQVQQQQQQPWANLNTSSGSLFETVAGQTGGGQSNGAGASPGLKLGSSSSSHNQPGMASNLTATARPVAGGGGAGAGGFIADFGSADIIFNANVISGPHHQQNGFGGGSNGLVKGAGAGSGLADKLNGNARQSQPSGSLFGAAATSKQEENFADFDHNPIFNSAGEFRATN